MIYAFFRGISALSPTNYAKNYGICDFCVILDACADLGCCGGFYGAFVLYTVVLDVFWFVKAFSADSGSLAQKSFVWCVEKSLECGWKVWLA